MSLVARTTLNQVWRILPVALILILTLTAIPLTGAGEAETGEDEISAELKAEILAPLREKADKIKDLKNSAGVKNQRATYSRKPRALGDDKYSMSFHHKVAEEAVQIIDRYEIVVGKNAKGDFEIASEEKVDSIQAMTRPYAANVYRFDKFSFDKEGMTVTASNGSVVEWYDALGTVGFALAAPDLAYSYTAPDYQDYQTLKRLLDADYDKEINFEPLRVIFECNPGTCDELINELFTGVERRTQVQAFANISDATFPAGFDSKLKNWMEGNERERNRDRKDNPFADFRGKDATGHQWYNVYVGKNDNHAIALSYDPWDGFEVQFSVFHNVPGASLNGPIFGYYTEETMKNTTPYDLETRDDLQTRWFHLTSLKGDITAGMDDDPEIVEGTVDYELVLKQDLVDRQLPFQIATIPRGEGEEDRKPTLNVNSVKWNDEDLTVIKTGRFNYRAIFPEVLKAGMKVKLSVDYSSRVLYKRNHAFMEMARGGWLPFVRFGDMIDTFEMTIKTPSKYKTLGIGRKVWEKQEGENKISHWVADSPVVFPSIILGKYIEDSPSFDAKKADGTPIPVTVHVDEVSKMQLAAVSLDENNINITQVQDVQQFQEDFNSGARGIRHTQLRPIAEQAANAINLYTEISGIDYPYGELNLVNDPAPAMYGQAPSSLIYLGSWVFRGEGAMVSDSFIGGGGTGTAKFLKSVTAHEVGHQWWGSRIANANSRNYWFVESLAEYFSAIYLEAVHGPDEYQQQVDEWRRRVLDIDQRVSVQNASVLWGGELGGAAYQAAVYNKGPYAFHILRQTFGDEKFFPFLKEFTMRLAEKGEIVSRDIQTVAEEALGGVGPDGQRYKVDLEWFFDQWIRGAGIPQYSFEYRVRRSEGNKYIVEGVVKQRVVIGNKTKYHVVDDKFYRGVVPITVTAKKGQEYKKMLVIEGPETTFQLSVPEKPLEVALNANGEILSLPVSETETW